MNTFPGVCSANKVTLIRTFNSWLQCNLPDMAQNCISQLCLHYPKLGATRMLWSCRSFTKRTGMLILRLRTTERTTVPRGYNFWFHSCQHRILYPYSETNVMHFLFNLLSIKGLYMFRALLTHPQEAPHKQHLLYLLACYVGWLHQGWSSTPTRGLPTDTTSTQVYQVPFVRCLVRMSK
jgi:hypothetical protein